MSNIPMNAPTISDRAMTTAVNLITSALVGQVTFLSSVITSRMNCTGLAIAGTAGLADACIDKYISQYQASFASEAYSLAPAKSAVTGLIVSKLANRNSFVN